MLLGFQQAILRESLAEDGLAVLGRGLGLHALLRRLAAMYGAPGVAPAVPAAEGGPRQALVLLLNVPKEQLRLLAEDVLLDAGLAQPGGLAPPLPLRVVNQEVTAAERARIYAAGGCVAAS